jgi:LysM repeat protein
MAAIDPGIRPQPRAELLLRRGTRLGVCAAYVTAAIVGLLLVRPAFESSPQPAFVAPRPAPAITDTLRKHETVATFAARHGLDLGELLALNPKVNSLVLPAGTKLRIH